MKLQVFVLGGLIECFVNGQFVQTCQAQKYAWGGLGLSVSGGTARFESLKIKTAAVPPRHYHAEGMFHWDTWYVPIGDSMHMFHLQVKRPGSQRPDADNETIGHAVSKDLIHWQEQPRHCGRARRDRMIKGPFSRATRSSTRARSISFTAVTGRTHRPSAWRHPPTASTSRSTNIIPSSSPTDRSACSATVATSSC